MHFPYANLWISDNGLLLYSQNNKSGCLTTQGSIGAKRIPPTKYLNLPELPIFSVVRNPYSRFLSSFRYCCLHRSNEHFKPWSPSDCTIDNYLYVLEYHSKHDNFRRLDPHQRPQSYNLGIDYINYDFIGKLEYLEEVLGYISLYGYKGIKTTNYHRTGAINEYKKILNSDHCSRIRKIFEKDFEMFDYPYDLDSSDAAKCLRFSPEKASLSQEFKMKVLIESLYKLYDNEKFKELCGANSKIISERVVGQFGIAHSNYSFTMMHLNPLLILMILSGDDFAGRLNQIISFLVQPTNSDRSLHHEDIDIVIKWCRNNGFLQFLDVLEPIRKYCNFFEFETQYLHIAKQDNFYSVEYNNPHRDYATPSPGILLRHI